MEMRLSRAGYVVLAILVATLVTACAPSGSSGGVSEGRAGAVPVEMVMDERAFVPRALTLSAGERVTFEITNEDNEPHDFAIESVGLNTGVIEPGGATTATIALGEGDTEFVCTLHPEMTGTITVT
jgi:plastocyanin